MFENDGCTFWFDQWFGVNLRACCDVHDEAFATGHTLQEFLQANWELFLCGWSSGAPVWALLALIGVCSPVGAYLFFFGSKRNPR